MLDLRQLDAVAADLHLAVVASKGLEPPIVQAPGAIPCPIPTSRHAGQLKLGELLACLVDIAKVAPGQTRTGDIELAGNTRGKRPAIAIQNDGRCPVDRPADGNGVAARIRAQVDLLPSRIDTSFRRTVEVIEARFRTELRKDLLR